jgi:hypothetical protein
VGARLDLPSETRYPSLGVLVLFLSTRDDATDCAADAINTLYAKHEGQNLPGFPAHHCSSITEAPNGDLLVLESNPGEYSYPSVYQISDGKIHVIYTFRRYSIKHVEMNENWLTHFERPN